MHMRTWLRVWMERLLGFLRMASHLVEVSEDGVCVSHADALDIVSRIASRHQI